jgi:hypothetical protein
VADAVPGSEERVIIISANEVRILLSCGLWCS